MTVDASGDPTPTPAQRAGSGNAPQPVSRSCPPPASWHGARAGTRSPCDAWPRRSSTRRTSPTATSPAATTSCSLWSATDSFVCATRWTPRAGCDLRVHAASDPEASAVRRAGHAYLDFALTEPDLYQLMYGLGGVRVPATDTWTDGQAVGDVLTGLLTDAGDPQPERHVLQLWATAHGLIALRVVGRVDVDPDGLHALLDDALTDCLTRALPAPTPRRRAARSTKEEPAAEHPGHRRRARRHRDHRHHLRHGHLRRARPAPRCRRCRRRLRGRPARPGPRVRRPPSAGPRRDRTHRHRARHRNQPQRRTHRRAIALAALLAWLAIYRRISAPINKQLRAAAANHTVPPDTRALQQRWDSVIWTRAALQSLALAGLLTAVLTR